MVINWPLAWYPPHVTSKRLIDEGVIGAVIEVHYYDICRIGQQIVDSAVLSAQSGRTVPLVGQ